MENSKHNFKNVTTTVRIDLVEDCSRNWGLQHFTVAVSLADEKVATLRFEFFEESVTTTLTRINDVLPLTDLALQAAVLQAINNRFEDDQDDEYEMYPDVFTSLDGSECFLTFDIRHSDRFTTH